MNVQKEKTYRPYLLRYLSFQNGQVYGKNYVFDDGEIEQELLKATPATITGWMRMYAFGKDEISPTDCPSIRSSTLDMCKKALSWYMPHRTAAWNIQSATGNPTKSKEVNELIKYIKTKEVRKTGQESSAKRAITQTEFCTALTILSSENSFQLRYRISTMMKLQYHLITRSDDLGHFKINHLQSHSDPRFCSFALQIKVFWSKNVLEERDCPDQILLGSMDSGFCILLALSIYLESWFTCNKGLQSVFLFSDDNNEELAPKRTKSSYAASLRTNVFSNPMFLSKTGRNGSEDLGSHSLRKFPATWASRNGCNADEIDVRGRWKRNSRRIVDRYIDVKQEFMDAKVQAALCVGGPIKYKLVPGSGITNDWCNKYVVPGICEYFGNLNPICNVLALPLLFACFDPELKTSVPAEILKNITDAYSQISLLPETVNPVQRILLNVYRINETLNIDEITADNDNRNNNTINININNNNIHNTQQINSAICALFVQNQQIKQQLLTHFDDTKTTIQNLNLDVNKKLNIINNNLQRISIQPPRMATPQQRIINNAEATRAAEEAELRRRPIAVLSSHPRNLYDLWTEYSFGIGGRKAAKDFTAEERGLNKFKYCRRKNFWDIISLHVRAGFEARTAIDRVYECYGKQLSVYTILDLIRKDKQTGGHPNLRL
jgi:hypothetical protein